MAAVTKASLTCSYRATSCALGGTLLVHRDSAARSRAVSSAAKPVHCAESEVSQPAEARVQDGAPLCARRRLLGAAAAAAVAANVALLFPAGGPSVAQAAAEPPTDDVVQGTQRLAALAGQAIDTQLRMVGDGIGSFEADEAALAAQREKYGVVTVPGLSSFSFIHGLLVGCAAIAFVATLRWGGSSTTTAAGGGAAAPPASSSNGGVQEGSGLDPRVEAALRAALSDAGPTFHEPAVHAALEEVRRDVSAIQKYRDDAAVMAAFNKLLEIEGILERL